MSEKKITKRDKKNNIKFIIITISVVVAILVGGYFFMNYYLKKQFEKEYDKAYESMKKEKYDDAINILSECRDNKCVDECKVSLLLGDIYVKQFEYKKAIDELEDSYNKTSSKEIKEKIDIIKKDKNK